MKKTVVMVGAILSLGLIAYPIVQGRYLEAVAISGVVSVLAWFALKGLEARGARSDHDANDGEENQ
ncbi:hypothetical protein [Magnetospira sp. QH-2]|uniref:hypothetical protein n=1 Tax=Magnetospira sp. (strain QH-2) TaxID=1288970 RepID=UPI0003E811B1|nr:hypothetical protein [Magnetospira sp. QH-2]CCQ72069.1 protein of unknown function [Magnetospira sp. QH-2]